MSRLCRFSFLFYIATFAIGFDAIAYDYYIKKYDNHLLHIVTIGADEYKIEMVKARDTINGREILADIAKNHDAEIAINAGFFIITSDPKLDGGPIRSLVIKGRALKLLDKEESFLLLKNNKLSVIYGRTKEYIGHDVSLVGGIPTLVKDHEVSNSVVQGSSSFFTYHHARTALGIKDDGSIIIMVVENDYGIDFTEMKFKDIYSIFAGDEDNICKKYKCNNIQDLTLMQVKGILLEKFRPANSVTGLSMIDLAKEMKALGCKEAINLDGGASSGLWIAGKIVNNSSEDGDDQSASPERKFRPIGDAIIFKKK